MEFAAHFGENKLPHSHRRDQRKPDSAANFKRQESAIYADEADLLNVALFGKTAAEFRNQNSEAEGNLRDNASLEQLVVMTNLESLNSVLIKQKLPQSERLKKLNEIAISQMKSLVGNNQLKRLVKN